MQHTADQGQTVTIGCQLSDFIKVNRDRRSPSSFLFLFRASRPPSAAWLSRRCGCRFPHLRQDLVGFTSARSCRGDTAYRVDHPLQARYSFPCHFNPPPLHLSNFNYTTKTVPWRVKKTGHPADGYPVRDIYSIDRAEKSLSGGFTFGNLRSSVSITFR